MGVYIIIHKQTALLYQNSSVWSDTRDVSSWDQNPAEFTPVGYLNSELASFST